MRAVFASSHYLTRKLINIEMTSGGGAEGYTMGYRQEVCGKTRQGRNFKKREKRRERGWRRQYVGMTEGG